MVSVPDEQRGHHDVAGSDAPTPPVGIPAVARPQVEEADAATPPTGMPELSGVVTAEDFGKPGPTVLGGPDPLESHEDAGDWPSLEYRRRARPSGGGRDWLGRRRDTE